MSDETSAKQVLEMGEQWRPVVGYEGFYEVSNMGRVKSIAKGMGRRGGIRKTDSDASGRQCLPLNAHPKKQKTYRVHRLVLEAFVGPCPEGQEACHDDGDPSNNKLGNLRWDTHLANERDKTRHGTRLIGETRVNAVFGEEDVMRMRDMHACGVGYPAIAKWFGVKYSTAYQALRGYTWAHLPYATGKAYG
jgi:hypothetical protein